MGHEGPTAHLGIPQEKATSSVTGGGLEIQQAKGDIGNWTKTQQLESEVLDPTENQGHSSKFSPLAAAPSPEHWGSANTAVPPSLSLGVPSPSR